MAKIKDSTYKNVLDNHELFAEFLRTFVPIPALQEVTADDIEDVSERFVPLFGRNRDGDTVKRVNIKRKTPLFIVVLAEHQRTVSYNMVSRLLQYMALIYSDYEREQDAKAEVERRRTGRSIKGLASDSKDFQLFPILPVVIYDGEAPWTAVVDFHSRVGMAEIFGEYIPQFKYLLLDLNKYSAEDLIKFNNLISFVLLVDKYGDMKGFKTLTDLPVEYIGMLRSLPGNLKRFAEDVVTALLRSEAVPEERIDEFVNETFDEKESRSMDIFARIQENADRLHARLIEKGRAEERALWQTREANWQTRESTWQTRESGWQSERNQLLNRIAELEARHL